MAKGFINDSTLTSIAGKIRTLNGTTATMTPAQMATAIQTAINSVSSARTAIVNKGVSVPTTIDVADLATYIGQIATGYQVTTGTVTVSSVTSYINVSHGLGKTPTYGCLLLASEATTVNYNMLGSYKYGSTSSGVWAAVSGFDLYLYGTSGSATLSASTATFTGGTTKANAQVKFPAGTYRYLFVG